MNHQNTFRPLFNLLAGYWAFISGFWGIMIQPINFFVIGIVIAIFGFWTYQREWQGYVNGIIGLWLIISSSVPALADSVNLALSGVVVVVLAIWRMVHIYIHWHWPTATG
jgi:hypothetical protein